jgi:hypothetical protein
VLENVLDTADIVRDGDFATTIALWLNAEALLAH